MCLQQFRPDITEFVRNSKYEKYPHHEQFYGQQDKIVDSERFSANMFGKLIRVANGIYQRQEYVSDAVYEKLCGELVTIDGQPYYITTVDNEMYPDGLFQKVTYSKNFNQLSQVVQIPSEPRFYEVSERSKIRREVRINDFLKLTNVAPPAGTPMPKFLSATTWKDFVKQLLFQAPGNFAYPNMVYTRFFADIIRHEFPGTLFPSSELDRTDPNNIKPKSASDNATCIVPVMHFPMHDSLLFEWNMEDNFKAGDFIDDVVNTAEISDPQAYKTIQALRYCDYYGRADWFMFKIFHKTDWADYDMPDLPKAVFTPSDVNSAVYVETGQGIALDKDCREDISFNYQINLLHGVGESTFQTTRQSRGRAQRRVRRKATLRLMPIPWRRARSIRWTAKDFQLTISPT